ncbi:DUF2520 domain-containing protein [Comamonadaceae bacterium M7527]|nr:DUF2520 domain-containing protein [Comamonadaceae bacterium M7527]
MSDIKHAFVGPGRLANTLAAAMRQAGHTVLGYVGNPQSMRMFDAQQSLGFQGLGPLSTNAIALADWVWITVGDDAIAHAASQVNWQPHQVALHCSGATELGALGADACSGAIGFHPLQIFSQPQVALQQLPGSSVGIEVQANAQHAATLWAQANTLAHSLQLKPLPIASGQRALYHAGAGYAASALVSMLAEATTLWREAGIDIDQALKALLPLGAGAIASIQAKGLAGAVAGPVARGDAGVVSQHLKALATVGADASLLYQQVAKRQLHLLAASQRLEPQHISQLSALLDSNAAPHEPHSFVSHTP